MLSLKQACTVSARTPWWSLAYPALLALSATAQPVAAQCGSAPCFSGLGDLPGGAVGSIARGISPDGSTVVGASYSAASGAEFEAFLWRDSTGIMGLGDLPGGEFMSNAKAASADGSVVVGWSSSALASGAFFPYEGFRWSAETGMVPLGDLGGGDFSSGATAITADGTRIAGYGHRGINNSTLDAVMWDNGAIWYLGDLASSRDNSGVENMSQNGQFAVGWGTTDASQAGGDYNEAFLWSATSGFTALGFLPGGTINSSVGLDVLEDGSTVVGYSGREPDDNEAFEWSPTLGIVGLGDLPGGTLFSRANAILRDGSLIVGRGQSEAGREALVWDSGRVRHRAADWLAARGVEIPAGWSLTICKEVTSNGNVITMCGDGTNPQGAPEAWIARYTESVQPCSGDYDGDRDVDLSDLGICLADFGCTAGPGLCTGDLDGDGDTDLSELGIVLAGFGQPCP